MKIIFLDVDGVLNVAGGKEGESESFTSMRGLFRKNVLPLLSILSVDPDIYIVIGS